MYNMASYLAKYWLPRPDWIMGPVSAPASSKLYACHPFPHCHYCYFGVAWPIKREWKKRRVGIFSFLIINGFIIDYFPLYECIQMVPCSLLESLKLVYDYL